MPDGPIICRQNLTETLPPGRVAADAGPAPWRTEVAAFDEAAEGRCRRWLADDVLPRKFGASVLDEELSGGFARSRVSRPRAYRLGRIMRSAQAAYDEVALQRVGERLDIGMRER